MSNTAPMVFRSISEPLVSTKLIYTIKCTLYLLTMVDVTKVYLVIITNFDPFLSGVSGSCGLSPSEGGHGGEQNHLQLPDLPLLTRPCAGTSSF